MADVNFDDLKRRAAAIAAVPAYIRAARQHAGGFEDRAVRRLCNWIGLPIAPLVEIREARGDPGLTFLHLHDATPDLPIRFAAGRLKFEYSGIAAELFNDFHKSPMYAAYREAREAAPGDLPMALVFSWPGVRKCRGYCAIHDVPFATASEAGTRITRIVRDTTLTIEPVPSLLDGLGLLRLTADDEPEDAAD
ncbi:MAG: hypothetical protein ABS79_00650 [Planctomycetes bacterium SCN 63-9]|nr:MAG: hypothetical protein ABS79_00650 [Planctomycetes bacterium SCN 63-9]